MLFGRVDVLLRGCREGYEVVQEYEGELSFNCEEYIVHCTFEAAGSVA